MAGFSNSYRYSKKILLIIILVLAIYHPADAEEKNNTTISPSVYYKKVAQFEEEIEPLLEESKTLKKIFPSDYKEKIHKAHKNQIITYCENDMIEEQLVTTAEFRQTISNINSGELNKRISRIHNEINEAKAALDEEEKELKALNETNMDNLSKEQMKNHKQLIFIKNKLIEKYKNRIQLGQKEYEVSKKTGVRYEEREDLLSQKIANTFEVWSMCINAFRTEEGIALFLDGDNLVSMDDTVFFTKNESGDFVRVINQ
jgi:hypothetical protein